MTEKQQAFLNALFSEECDGDLRTAARVAGYSDGTPLRQITDPLADQIVEATKKYLASKGPKAAAKLTEFLDEASDPLGGKERLSAAKDVLDRIGVVKTEKVEIDTENPIFILPPKREKSEIE